MATLQEIANLKTDCGGGDANTGKKGCQIEFGTPLSVIRLKKGTVIPKETVFSKAYIDGLIIARTATPLIGAVAFDDQGAEDGLNTLSSGIERLNLLGLPKYMLEFQEGHEFYREISGLTSYRKSDFILFDEAGNMAIAINSDGDYVGFSAGQVIAMPRKSKVQGGDNESRSVSVQFINRKQWDSQYVIIEQNNLDFDVEEDIAGANSATVSFTTTPTASDTGLLVNIVLDSDMSTPVGGLSTGSEIKLTVNGVAIVPTTVTEGSEAGSYTISFTPVLSSSDVVVVGLNGVLEIEGCLYASGDTTIVTIA